jgi:hypothetical protein
MVASTDSAASLHVVVLMPTRDDWASASELIQRIDHAIGPYPCVRLLIGSMAGSLMAALGIIAVVMIRYFTDKAIPGWATYATGMLVVILIQFINLSFVPLRDYSLFVAGTTIEFVHD